MASTMNTLLSVSEVDSVSGRVSDVSALDEVEFHVDETVFAFHGPLLYEAKVMKVEEREGTGNSFNFNRKTNLHTNVPAQNASNTTQNASNITENTPNAPQNPPQNPQQQNHHRLHYLVHYLGWNKKWDEWVDATRLKKCTEQTRMMAQNLKLQFQQNTHNQTASGSVNNGHEGKKTTGTGTGTGTEKGTGKKTGPGRKRKSTGDGNAENTNANGDTEIDENGKAGDGKIKLPAALKKQLVVDWENVTRKQRLVPLPKPKGANVQSILNEYKESKQRSDASETIVQEVVTGLQNYFDRALGLLLLYKFERPQYEELANEHANKAMSELYGAEHLLRLLIKIPHLLTMTKIDHKETAVMLSKVNEFLKWLDKRIDQPTGVKLLAEEYEVQSKDYWTRVAA